MKNPNEIIANFPFLADFYDPYCGNFIVPADECSEMVHGAFIVVENDPENEFKVYFETYNFDEECVILSEWEY